MMGGGSFFLLFYFCAPSSGSIINDFVTNQLCVIVHSRAMFIWLELALIIEDCRTQGEGNRLMTISLSLSNCVP